MLSNNSSCLSVRSCAVRVTIFSDDSIIPPSFKFMKLHALTLAAHFYALLNLAMSWQPYRCCFQREASCSSFLSFPFPFVALSPPPSLLPPLFLSPSPLPFSLLPSPLLQGNDGCYCLSLLLHLSGGPLPLPGATLNQT